MVLVDQWTSVGEGNNTWSFSSVVSGWTKVMKECNSWACLAQWRRCSCVGIASQKFHRGNFSWFGLCPRKPQNLNTLRNLYPYSTWFLKVYRLLVAQETPYYLTHTVSYSWFLVFNFSCQLSELVCSHTRWVYGSPITTVLPRDWWILFWTVVQIIKKNGSLLHKKSANCLRLMEFVPLQPYKSKASTGVV